MPENIVIPLGFDASSLSPTVIRAVNEAQSRIRDIKLKIDARPLGTISRDLTQFDRSLEASNARVLAFGASVGIITGVTAAFTSLVKSTIEVEKRLTDIQVVLQASQKNFTQFTEQLFNVAKATGQSFETVATAATEFSRQGLGVPEILKRTNDALILSRLSGLSAAEAVQDLTAAINTFKSAAIDSTSVINKLATVDAAFAVSSADLAEAIKRTGSAAEDAKVSLDELIAIVTSAQQTTARGGAVIGNAFKTIFTRLGDDSTLNALEELNIKVRDIRGNTLPALQVLQNLANRFDSLSDSQQNATAKLVGGLFQINILRASLGDLSSGLSVYERALNTSTGAVDEAIKRNEALNQTFSALLNKTQVNLKQFFASVGKQTFEPIGKNAFNLFNALFDSSKSGNGTQEKSFGQKVGQGLINGVSDFLKGPAIVIVGALLYKLFANAFSSAQGAFKSVVGFNSETERQKNIQEGINRVLASGNTAYQQRIAAARSVAEQEQIVLDILRQENAILTQRKGVNAAVASGLVGKVSFPNESSTGSAIKKPAFASGFVPSVAQELKAVRAGVGGASHAALPVEIKGFNFGGGKKGDIVANTSEYLVEQFEGGSGTAVFNPEMIKQVGGIANLNKLGKVRKVTAASGFVPNFAKTRLGNGLYGTFFDLGKKINGKRVGKKEFFMQDAHMGNDGKFNVEQEFYVSKILAGLNSETHPVVKAPEIFGRLGRSRDRLAIGKEVIGGVTGKEFLEKVKERDGVNPMDFNVKMLTALKRLTKDFVYDDYFKAGVGINDLHHSNYMLNPRAQGALLRLAKKKSLDEVGYMSGKDIADYVAQRGGRVSVVDAGLTELVGKSNTPARKISEKLLTQFRKDGDMQSFARGFVPNFANDPLAAAVEREKAAGLPESQIYVDHVNTPRYSGPVVANRRDEPNRSALLSRVNSHPNPAAAGLIPNFAEKKFSKKEIGELRKEIYAALKNVQAEDARRKAFAQFEDVTSPLGAKEAGLVSEQLLRQFFKDSGVGNFDNSTLQKATPKLFKAGQAQVAQQLAQRQFQYSLQQAVVNEQKPRGFFGDVLGSYGIERRINRAAVPSNEADAITRTNTINQLRKERSDRLQNRGFQASFLLPALAGQVQSFAGVDPETRQGRIASGITSAVSGGVSVAALAPGPVGLALGATIAAFGSLKAVTGNLKDNFEAFAGKLRDNVNVVGEKSSSVANVLQAQSNLQDIVKNGGSPAAIAAASAQLNQLITDVPQKLQSKVREAVDNNDTNALLKLTGKTSLQKSRAESIAGALALVGKENEKNGLYRDNVANFVGPSRINAVSAQEKGGGLFDLLKKGEFAAALSRAQLNTADFIGTDRNQRSLRKETVKAFSSIQTGFDEDEISKFEKVRAQKGSESAFEAILSDVGFNRDNRKNAVDQIRASAGNSPEEQQKIFDEIVQKMLKQSKAASQTVKNYEASVVKSKRLNDLLDRFSQQVLARTQLSDLASQNRRDLAVSGVRGFVEANRQSISPSFRNKLDYDVGTLEVRNNAQKALAGLRTGLLSALPDSVPSSLDKSDKVRGEFVNRVAALSQNPNATDAQGLLKFIDSNTDGQSRDQETKNLQSELVKFGAGIQEVAINTEQQIRQLEQQKVLAQQALRAEERSKVLGGDFRQMKDYDFSTVRQGLSAGRSLGARGGSPRFMLDQGNYFDNFFNPRQDTRRNNSITRDRQRRQAEGSLELLDQGLLRDPKNIDAVRSQVKEATKGQLLNNIDTLLRDRNLPASFRRDLLTQRGDVDSIAEEQSRRLVPVSEKSKNALNSEIQQNLDKARVSTRVEDNIQIVAAEARKTAENTLDIANTLRALAGASGATQTEISTTATANKASGHLPNLFKESAAIRNGVGGALSSDRPLIRNVKGLGNVVVNSGERVIQDFLGTGKGAVLTRQMQQDFSRGFVPNFANSLIDLDKAPEKGVKFYSNPRQFLISRLRAIGTDPNHPDAKAWLREETKRIRSGGVIGESGPGERSAFINRKLAKSLGRSREAIAHESFHAKFGTLGRSETLARFVGAYKAPRGANFFDRVASGTKEAFSYNKQLLTGGFQGVYGNFFNRENSLIGDLVRRQLSVSGLTKDLSKFTRETRAAKPIVYNTGIDGPLKNSLLRKLYTRLNGGIAATEADLPEILKANPRSNVLNLNASGNATIEAFGRRAISPANPTIAIDKYREAIDNPYLPRTLRLSAVRALAQRPGKKPLSGPEVLRKYFGGEAIVKPIEGVQGKGILRTDTDAIKIGKKIVSRAAKDFIAQEFLPLVQNQTAVATNGFTAFPTLYQSNEYRAHVLGTGDRQASAVLGATIEKNKFSRAPLIFNRGISRAVERAAANAVGAVAEKGTLFGVDVAEVDPKFAAAQNAKLGYERYTSGRGFFGLGKKKFFSAIELNPTISQDVSKYSQLGGSGVTDDVLVGNAILAKLRGKDALHSLPAKLIDKLTGYGSSSSGPIALQTSIPAAAKNLSAAPASAAAQSSSIPAPAALSAALAGNSAPASRKLLGLLDLGYQKGEFLKTFGKKVFSGSTYNNIYGNSPRSLAEAFIKKPTAGLLQPFRDSFGITQNSARLITGNGGRLAAGLGLAKNSAGLLGKGLAGFAIYDTGRQAVDAAAQGDDLGRDVAGAKTLATAASLGLTAPAGIALATGSSLGSVGAKYGIGGIGGFAIDKLGVKDGALRDYVNAAKDSSFTVNALGDAFGGVAAAFRSSRDSKRAGLKNAGFLDVLSPFRTQRASFDAISKKEIGEFDEESFERRVERFAQRKSLDGLSLSSRMLKAIQRYREDNAPNSVGASEAALTSAPTITNSRSLDPLDAFQQGEARRVERQIAEVDRAVHRQQQQELLNDPKAIGVGRDGVILDTDGPQHFSSAVTGGESSAAQPLLANVIGIDGNGNYIYDKDRNVASGFIPNFSVLGSSGGLNRGAYNVSRRGRSRSRRAFDSVGSRRNSKTLESLILSGIIGGEVGGQNLQESIAREQEALRARGYHASGLIQVGYSPRIGGLGVYNKIDEPFGLEQGVDRVIRQGGNPMQSGQVPNFAESFEKLNGAIEKLSASSPAGSANSLDVLHNHNVQLSLGGEIRSANAQVASITNEEFAKMKETLEARLRELEVTTSKTNKDFFLRPQNV